MPLYIYDASSAGLLWYTFKNSGNTDSSFVRFSSRARGVYSDQPALPVIASADNLEYQALLHEPVHGIINVAPMNTAFLRPMAATVVSLL